MGIAQTSGVKPPGIERRADLDDHEQPGAQPVNLHIQDAVLVQMFGNFRPDALVVALILLNQRR
ncbi:Uncharacterised protein [Serratia plymuthica]|uniref:Uncharacterized protein n=1 Tax=Serratia plymuthica TaxID=82996 RepID=A0A2X4TUD7_SERPL|nr:Uncharacterised protein [Serratia plymuthica]